jgi:hypothetical protein
MLKQFLFEGPAVYDICSVIYSTLNDAGNLNEKIWPSASFEVPPRLHLDTLRFPDGFVRMCCAYCYDVR